MENPSPKFSGDTKSAALSDSGSVQSPIDVLCIGAENSSSNSFDRRISTKKYITLLQLLIGAISVYFVLLLLSL